MAKWEYLSVDIDSMERGVFYSVYTNHDNATLVLKKSIQDAINDQVNVNKLAIDTLKTNQTELTSEVTNVVSTNRNLLEIVTDNRARINNLENNDLSADFLRILELHTIRKNFTNSQNIEIEFGRKEIISIAVYILLSDTNGIQRYQEMSTGITKELVVDGVIKKIVLKPNEPITGYALIL